MTARTGYSGLQVSEIIFDWAGRTPDKAAIVHNGRPLSYGDLAANVAVARGFFVRQRCVGAGVAVLAVENLRDFWILSLALRSLGLTTIAVSSSAFIGELGLPDVRCVVTSPAERWPGLEDVCAAEGFRLVTVSIADATPLALGEAAPPDGPGGHILLTSATTGAYKKVLMDPAFEPAFFRPSEGAGALTADSIVNLFDFAAWTGGHYKWAVSAFTRGATVVIDQRPERFRALLYPGITHSLIVPGMLESLLAAPLGTLPPGDKMSLQVGGGPLTQRQIDQIRTRITRNLFNSLGATETRSIAYTLMTSPEDYRWHQPTPGTDVQIVDELDRPAQVGEVGRLRVGTKNGPTGYLHDEEATKAFFRHGYFYTGDLAEFRADGRMALHGRITDVINVNGHKLSPEPFELALRDSLAVSGVCLFSMQDAAGEEEVHVVIETPTAIEMDRLTAILRRELHGFPRARVHYTAQLPRNAMGKLLRPAAREQALGRARQA